MVEFTWTKYNSIHNLTKGYIPFNVNIPDNPDYMYVGLEKLHGANFSIICENDNNNNFVISYARRNDILKKDENFHDYLNVMEKSQECINSVVNKIKNEYNNVELITIYGELFGGEYEGYEKGDSKPVQKEIQYHPEYKFIPFDIKVDKKFLNWNKFVEIIKETNFKLLEPLIIGDYETVVNFEVEQQITKIPELYNLPPIQSNFMEGIIIKPTEELYDRRDNRIIIKKKTKQFTEKNKTGGVIIVPENIQKIQCYITKNRLNNIISKELEVSVKDTGRLIKLLLDDSFEEYLKETTAVITAKNLKIARKMLTLSAVLVVRKYFDELYI
jgi:Rnl2 family RNA ligase